MSIGERSSMVEYQLPKLATGVRFSSLAPVLTILLLVFLAGCATAPKKEIVIEKRLPGVTYHTVKRGETLWSISKAYNIEIDALVNANSIEDRGSIENGQLLIIPRGIQQKQEVANYPVSNELFAWPIRGVLLTPFGAIADKVVNKGIDIKAPEGGAVRASRSGKVVYCDPHLKGFGKTVIIDHGDRYQTVYSYNSMILVNLSDQVSQNAVIAKVGKTGRAKVASLHFEIRKDGKPQNPSYFLPR